jgi:hypothetical protein
MSAIQTLLRLLFPSWAFFDHAGDVPELEVRPQSAQLDVWYPVVQPPARRWWQMFLNPRGTQALAVQTLVERWHSEVEESEESVVTRALVERLVAEYVRASGDSRVGPSWEYRLVVDHEISQGAGSAEFVDARHSSLLQRSIQL